MAGVHGLQQIIGALVAYFTEDDAVGPMPQSRCQQRTRKDRNLTWNCVNGFPTESVRLKHSKLCNLLDHDKPVGHRNVVKNGLH